MKTSGHATGKGSGIEAARHRRFSPARMAVGVLLAAVLSACLDVPDIVTLDPDQDTGFLAVITKVVGPEQVSPGQQWTISLQEISGTYAVKESRVLSPGDTVIFNVPPASYDVLLGGLPAACTNRYGLGRRAVVYEPKSTSVLRYNIECVALLTIATGTDGLLVDESYVYRVLQDEREIRIGTIGPNEELVVDGLDLGAYTVELLHVDPACAVLNDGGRRQTVEVAPPFSPVVRYRVTCSRPEYRPEMIRFAAERMEGASVVYFEATDPGSEVSGLPDLDRFYWDVSGCDGTSLLRNGPREFRGFRAPGSRLFGADTARVVFVLPGELPESPTGQYCMAVRAADGEGNTTAWSRDRIGDAFGTPPAILSLDVSVVDLATDPKVRFLFSVADAEDDLAGMFVTFEVMDGTFGQPDGKDEVWVPNVQGWDGPVIPDLRMVSFPFSPERLVAVHVYAVDRWGNATKRVDADLGLEPSP